MACGRVDCTAAAAGIPPAAASSVGPDESLSIFRIVRGGSDGAMEGNTVKWIPRMTDEGSLVKCGRYSLKL